MTDAKVLIWQFLGLLVIYVASSITSSYLIAYLSQELIQGMRITLSNKILKAAYHKLENQTKRLFTILTDDINAIANTVNKLPTILTGFTQVLGCFLYMLFISWQLFALFMVVFLITFILYRLPLNSYNERLRMARSHQNELFGHFEGLIYGLKELTLNRKFRESYTDSVIRPLCDEQKRHFLYGNTIVEVFSRWGEMILLLGIGAILLLIREYAITEYSVLVQFLTVTLFTISPLSKITSYMPQMRRINVALEQIDEAGLDLDETIAVSKHHKFEKPHQPFVSLREVTYTYYHADEEKFFQLGPISLEIEKGEIIFLIGGNGSGKSTLAKILCGLYPPQDGEVYSFGQKIDTDNIESFRDQFTAIFSDYYLFEHMYHIDSEVIVQNAQKYLKLLELDKKVKIEGQRLSTTQLSTGQKKRLVLLLSYLEDKPFYLFDEWAAGLDPHYKKVFYKHLIPDLQKQGKTVFVITHDETYFDCADKVLMLKDGKLLDSHLLHDQLADFFGTSPVS